MSQVIIIPFSDQVIGQGFNSESRQNVGTALTVAEVSDDPVANGQVVWTSFQSVTTQESLLESLGVSVSADARYGLFSGGAKMDFATSNAVNSYSSFIVGRCEVHNATRHSRGLRLTPEAEAMVRSGNQKGFKTAFGDMFVRALKTGGEFYVVARITSVSQEEQNSLSASLHGEYNGALASGSFQASLKTAMSKTSNRTEVTVVVSQAGGVGAQNTFTGPDAVKIMERLREFPQSVLEHPVGYEAELATYDTIPIDVLTPEESADRDIVLTDCLHQKMALLKGISDLRFALGPNGPVFFEELPERQELQAQLNVHQAALNGLMAHAILVATGKMSPPQLFIANPAPLPVVLKKREVTENDRGEFARVGADAAKADALMAEVRVLQAEGPRRVGFDIGVGVTSSHTLWGPGKQRILDSLSLLEQVGFKEAAAFILARNNHAVLALKGAEIATRDAEVSTARKIRPSGLYWVGFDIATGIFGDPALGALGNTAMGPGSEKIRATASEGEHVLLPTREIESGFNAAFAFHKGRKRL